MSKIILSENLMFRLVLPFVVGGIGGFVGASLVLLSTLPVCT